MKISADALKVMAVVAVAGGAIYVLYRAGQKVDSAISSALDAAPKAATAVADASKYAFGEVVNFGGAAANSYGNMIQQVSPTYYNWAAKQDFLYPVFDYFTGNNLAKGSN